MTRPRKESDTEARGNTSSEKGDIEPESNIDTIGSSFKRVKILKRQARRACVQFKHEQFPEHISEDVAIMNQYLDQQRLFTSSVVLQQNRPRTNISYYEPLLQFISDEMALGEHKDMFKMSRNDQ